MENKKEKNEDAVEVKETPAPEEPVENTKPAPVPVPAAQPAASEKTPGWGEKNVTRKFLSIALAIALALNVALTAGAVKLLGHNKGFNRGDFGRPGNEQRFDNNRGGRNNMMPTSGNQAPDNQQNQQSDTQQNDNQQNNSQQSDDQNSSEQKSA